MIATAAGLSLFLWGYAVAATSVYGAARAAWQRRRLAVAVPRPGARVLVVRPCAGLEPGLERALLSLRLAHSTARIACRFAVEGPSDPAASVATSAAASLREAGIDAAVVLTAASAPNHKAAQIAAVIAREPRSFDALLIADSDVDLEGFDLDLLVGPLLGREAVETGAMAPGAVWAPPVEAGPLFASGDRASRAILAGSLHAFTLLGALDSRGLVGKLCAVRRDALEAVGGFGAMERVLGEDMELCLRLRANGHAVLVAPTVARSLKTGRTWQSAVERYARWLTVIRTQRPHLLASYPLLFVSAPLLLTASLLLAPFSPSLALATVAITGFGRIVSALAARKLAGLSFSLRETMTDIVLSDALLAHAFVRAIATRTVTWRGRTLTIDRGGLLCES